MGKNASLKFLFQVNQLPSRPAPNRPRFLFNNPEYLSLHPGLQHDQFHIISQADDKVQGTITFRRIGDSAVSLARATFGSLEITGEPDYFVLQDFFRYLVQYYKSAGVKSIVIHHYSPLYDPVHEPVVTAALVYAGLKVETFDLNHHFPVTGDAFEVRVNKMEGRQLKKCMAKGLEFGECRKEDLTATFDQMIIYRQEKNIPVTFSTGDLVQAVQHLPGIYSLYRVTGRNGELLAAVVMVKITDRIWYYFSPVNKPEKDGLSPMVLLLNEIYSLARNAGMEYIDLGVSSSGNIPQQGLIRFKQNLGGIPTGRLTFRIDL